MATLVSWLPMAGDHRSRVDIALVTRQVLMHGRRAFITSSARSPEGGHTPDSLPSGFRPFPVGSATAYTATAPLLLARTGPQGQL